MIISNTKRHPNNTKTDQLPISEVITGLPRSYHQLPVLPGISAFDTADTARTRSALGENIADTAGIYTGSISSVRTASTAPFVLLILRVLAVQKMSY